MILGAGQASQVQNLETLAPSKNRFEKNAGGDYGLPVNREESATQPSIRQPVRP